MDEAFHQLQHQPIGATLAIFLPDYVRDQKGIYGGPTRAGSRLASFHAVSLVAEDEDENGERYVLARSSEGDDFGHDGCIEVSYDTLILCLSSVPYPTSQLYTTVQFRLP
ncbi:unnamed protein product [Microthlaspi erraticum]|uniref:Peptidase C1A papain C-terminal domain-containing protein n=1 Tax=Microthlaspi erraticum TaxID=1685480 RepID=A0A6D2JYS1_9BRAS|nr:unnamed protein product [Microthlaspi erraticum]